jgi:hypothetical protein
MTHSKPGLDADEAIDALIERRSQEREQAKREASSWAQSAASFDARATAERRREWYAFHLDMKFLHEALAREHERQAGHAAGRRGIEGGARSMPTSYRHYEREPFVGVPGGVRGGTAASRPAPTSLRFMFLKHEATRALGRGR